MLSPTNALSTCLKAMSARKNGGGQSAGRSRRRRRSRAWLGAEAMERRCLLSMDPTTPIPGITGVDAPPINAQYTDGTTFTLPSVNQPILVMDFWATWCGWCMLGMPGTQDLSNWARDNGKPVKVVAVNLEESLSTIQASWAANGYTLPVAMDTDGKIFSDYGTPFGAGGIPFYVVVAGGKITWQQCGYSSNVETLLQNEINRIVAMIPATNNPPTDITLSASSVQENQPVGTSVGTFATSDPDVGGTFTYTLVSGAGAGDNAQFTINGDQLKTAASFNFETQSSYSVRVRTTDSGGLWFEKAFTIGVTNVNEPATDLGLSATSIPENQPVGTTVGSFSTSDPDAGDTFTYLLVAGTGSTDNGSFTVSGNQLKTAASFDYETKSSYSVRVRVTDAGGLWFEKVFAIAVTDVAEGTNHAPTDVSLSGTSVAENQPSGTAVGSLATTDSDAGDTFTYALVSGIGAADNASFSIASGQLRTAAAFDYETKSSYSIRVRTTDQGGLYYEKAFTISVINVNETPVNISLSGGSVTENQPVGTTVGTFSTTDGDIGNPFTYMLVSGAGSTDNASFTISGNELKTAEVFDFTTKSSYAIRVRTMDQGGLAYEKTFAISVTRFNTAPTDITLAVASIAENQPTGTIVGSLAAVDADAGDTATFSLVSGAGSTDNSSFGLAGTDLRTSAVFDLESKNSYSIRVRATDTGGLSFEKAFIISVTNVNEAPTALRMSATSIAENVAVGTTVGNLSVVDPDIGETYSYEILPGVDQASFAVSGNQLKTAVGFDYEAKRSYSITIRAHDGANTYDQSLLISVTNVNEAPTAVTLSNTSVAENLAAGTTVGTLSTIDPDTIGSYSYEILPGGDAAAFTLTSNKLKTAASFNYESKASYSITVRVHDGANTLDQPLTISVTDVNEPPTGISLSASSVPENQPTGTVIGILSIADPDSDEAISYEILPGGDAASFAMVGDQLTTAGVFDYESKVNYSITLRVYDGMFTQDKPFTITVTDLVEFGMLQGKARPATIPDSDGDLVTFSLTGGGTGTIQPGNSITLAGTNAKSTLTISVKKGRIGDGQVTIGDLTSDGLLKGIKASTAVLSGQVHLNTLNQTPGTAKVSLQFLQLRDASIEAQNLPIASLKLLDWQDTDANLDLLTAPSIGSITISGRKENLKTGASEYLPGDLDASVTVGGGIGSIKAAGSITGTIRSGKDAKGSGIGSITASGSISGATIVTTGSIGKFSAAALLDSDILVGVATDFAGQFAGHGDFANTAAKLGSLTVKGKKLPKGSMYPAYVVNSHISAPSVGTVSLLNVAAGADAVVHVMTDAGVLKVSQTKLVDEEMFGGGTWKKAGERPVIWDVV